MATATSAKRPTDGRGLARRTSRATDPLIERFNRPTLHSMVQLAYQFSYWPDDRLAASVNRMMRKMDAPQLGGVAFPQCEPVPSNAVPAAIALYGHGDTTIVERSSVRWSARRYGLARSDHGPIGALPGRARAGRVPRVKPDTTRQAAVSTADDGSTDGVAHSPAHPPPVTVTGRRWSSSPGRHRRPAGLPQTARPWRSIRRRNHASRQIQPNRASTRWSVRTSSGRRCRRTSLNP